jgi:hypothetical protein
MRYDEIVSHIKGAIGCKKGRWFLESGETLHLPSGNQLHGLLENRPFIAFPAQWIYMVHISYQPA